jgi:hypothetical protein
MKKEAQMFTKLEKWLDKRRLALREKWNVNQEDLELDVRLDELVKIFTKIDELKEWAKYDSKENYSE